MNSSDVFRALDGGYLRMVANLDLRICHHPIAKIRGHAPAQVTATHYQLTVSRLLRKEHRRLPGGVARADDMHRPALAHPRLDRRSVVVKAGSEQVVRSFHVEQALENPRRDDHRLTDGHVALASTHLVETVAATLQFRHMARCDELRAELERLQVGELCQFASSHTVGETRVVFDLRAGAGLSSRPDSVEHQS